MPAKIIRVDYGIRLLRNDIHPEFHKRDHLVWIYYRAQTYVRGNVIHIFPLQNDKR